MSLPGGRAFGMAPAVANYQSFVSILQGPTGSPYHLYTFPATGRIWAASVTYAMGVGGGGTGVSQGYARVHIASGNTLAIVEACVAGATANDSNTDALDYFGLVVPAGTIINLDVNGGATITNVVQRASGLVGVSVP